MKRQRREHLREQPLPFAGLQHLSETEEPISLAIYGVAATLHPVSPDLIDDEGSELVPWPEGSSDPVLVDRFDCRLLLDPLELRAASPSHRTTAQQQSAGGGSLSAEEAELDEERWRDLRCPPAQHYLLEEQEENRYDAVGYAAVDFSYENQNQGDARINYKQLHPPATPPWLPSDVPLLDALQDSLPFSAVEYAVMTRTAAFLGMCSDGGRNSHEAAMEILSKKTENNLNFAFLDPAHRLHDFFLGLLENLDAEKSATAAALAGEESEAEKLEGNALEILVADYGSGSESEDAEEVVVDEENQIKNAIIARTAAAFLYCSSAEEAAELCSKLAANPLFEFLDTESGYFDAFCGELERRGFEQEILSALIMPQKAKTEAAKPPVPRAPMILASAVLEAVKPAAYIDRNLPPWILDRMEGPKKESNDAAAQPSAADATPAAAIDSMPSSSTGEILKRKIEVSPASELRKKELEEAKKAARKKKVRLLLQRQEQLRAEQKQEQAAAQRQAEEERNKHLEAISVHKRMFLDDDDDDE